MAIRFTIGGHIEERTGLGSLLEHPNQQSARGQRLFKSDGAGQWPIIEKDPEGPSSLVNVPVNPAGIDASRSNLLPVFASNGTKMSSLLGRQNDKLQTLIDQQPQSSVITS